MHIFPPPIIYEIINFFLTALSLCVLVIFGRYIVIELINHGWERNRLSGAVAISVVMAGESMTRGWTWLGRYIKDTGGISAGEWMSIPPWAFIPMIGAVVTAIGALCMVRIFSPDRWGPAGWLWCASIAIAATTLELLLRP